MKTKTTKRTTKASKNGTPPTRTIVTRLPGSKKDRYIAVLKCGHRYSKGKAWPRTTLRCRRCLVDGPVKTKTAKTKTAKTAATVKTTTNGNGGSK